MAKKKVKTQVTNTMNILSLEIDYDKLAEAIVKAQEKSQTPAESKNKIGFWKAVWLIIRNKEPKNGNKTAYILAEILAWIFNTFAIGGVLVFILICFSISRLNWTIDAAHFIAQVVVLVLLLGTALSISLIFRGIANEIKAEKDRNYITALFFGFSSLASLIVALVELSKGVG